jgi:hypothetical protein
MAKRIRKLQEKLGLPPGSEAKAQQSSALEFALRWAELPPKRLEATLKALEPELAREHQRRLEHARLAAQDEQDRRNHKLYLGGLIAGFILAASMTTGAVIAGVCGLPWLAAVLLGPSVVSLVGVFVLRRFTLRVGRRKENDIPDQ